MHTMSAYFASAAGDVDRAMTSMTLAAVIMAMAACDVASLGYAAGAVSHTVFDSLLAIAITVRSLGLFTRLLVVMMYNDEQILLQHQLADETRRLQAEHDNALRRVYRYVFHELRVPLNSLVLGLSVLLQGVAQGVVLADVQDVLSAMQGAGDSMMRVLCDLLDLCVQCDAPRQPLDRLGTTDAA
jgi:signal transduction histidine kinase